MGTPTVVERRGLPTSALTWAASLAQAPVVRVEPVAGGLTGTKWVLHLATGDPVVLRWSDPRTWGAVGREHVRREALGCELLVDTGLPVPHLLGSDPDGEHASGPANLLTWRPGEVRLDPLEPAAIAAWAGVAAAVHRQPVPVGRRPPLVSARGPAEPQVPAWARRPALWRHALALWAAGPPPTRLGLLHRDFHLGNTLWQGDVVSGVVDWAETSWGPADLDVAHACCDFAMVHTLEDAATFRAAYLQHGGRLDPDPDAARYWVVADVLGFLPDPAHILAGMADRRPDLTPDAVRHGLEDLLALTLD